MTTSHSQLSCIEINPKTKPCGTIIWLHGLGADGNDFVPIVSELNLSEQLPIRFVFPHAPMRAVTINGGYVMRAWYDIVSTDIDRHADRAGIEESVQQVHQLIENEINMGTPADKIILAGFSQGALIALTTGLAYPKRLAGILALSGYLPEPDKTIREALNKTIPIFLGHGTEDTIVPVFLGELVYTALKNAKVDVSWHKYPMAHSVCMDEIRDIGEWLKKVYA